MGGLIGLIGLWNFLFLSLWKVRMKEDRKRKAWKRKGGRKAMYIGTVRLCYDGNYLGYFEYLLMSRHNYNTSHMNSSRERERGKVCIVGFILFFWELDYSRIVIR